MFYEFEQCVQHLIIFFFIDVTVIIKLLCPFVCLSN